MKKKLITLHQFIDLLSDEVKKAGSQKDLAKKFGVSAQYVSDVLNGKREPGEAILEPLGLRKVIVYELVEGCA